ncbi:MAG TPA: Rieske (2Fe-2S) protein [Terriglobales bacterium]|jgi:Rieske Fe-S protein
MAETRRGIVQWLLGGGFTASFVAFFYPVLRFMNPPPVSEAAVHEVTAGKVNDLKVNTGRIVKFGSTPALLIRAGETEWRAFSGICTHLNCTVQYHESNRQIWCACHNGFYDLTGRVAAGPPPRPLEEFAVRIRGDEVVISRKA